MTPERIITDPRRINSMATHMTPQDIALRLGLSEAEVVRIIRRDAKAAYWVARCNRTGREKRAFTERGAYLRAQIAGFADWELFGVRKEGV